MDKIQECAGEIITTNDFNVIADTLQSPNQDTLVIFDVGDVLLQPQDQILKSHHHVELESFEKMIDQTFSKTMADELYSVIWLNRKIDLIDERLPPSCF